MTLITDDQMMGMLSKIREYSLVILKKGSNYKPGIEKTIWEHARRNFMLREEGKLSIVCPINDGTDVTGVGIFNADLIETKAIMDDDPGVKDRIFEYEVHTCRSFPGDCLPVK